MQSYGNYEIDREIASGQGTVVYSARPPGKPGAPTCAVKVFSPNLLTLLDAATSEELNETYKGITRDGLRKTEIQKQAAAISPHVAPILDHGQDATTVWYATRLYPQSLQQVLNSRVQLREPAILNILRSAVRGSRAVQQACGRPHGNLKPSNIFLERTTALQTATVVVADPVAGEPADAETLELADLKALGQILYQIVRRKPINSSEEWEGMILPLELSGEWTTAFGKNAARWLSLCNRLLDRHLTLEQFDLARLEQELQGFESKRIVSPRLALGLLGLVLAGGFVLWWLLRPSKVGELIVESDPVGGTVLTNGQAAGKAPWKGKIALGTNVVSVTNEWLGTLSTNLVVERAKTTKWLARFVYGGVRLTTGRQASAGVKTREGLKLGDTPFSQPAIKPGPYIYRLERDGFRETNVAVLVQAGSTTNVDVELSPVPPGAVRVIVDIDPPGLRRGAIITNLTEQQASDAPGSFDLRPGPQAFRILLPPPWPQLSTNITIGASRMTNVVVFPWCRLDLASKPAGAEVWAGTNLVGFTPTNLLWPTGSYAFEWRLLNHATNRVETNLLDTFAFSSSQTLTALFSPVRLVANLEGARVRATNAQTGEVGRWIVGRDGTNVSLPGTNTLVAEFEDEQLGRLDSQVVREAAPRINFTNRYQFDFEYGVARIRPPEGVTVSVSNLVLTKRPEILRFQKPDAPTVYQFAKLHFLTTNVSVAVARARTNLVENVTLKPKDYPLFVDVQPDDPQVKVICDNWPSVQKGMNSVPWGDYRIVARHDDLGVVSNRVSLVEEGTATNALRLPYARVRLSTKQKGLRVVMDGARELGLTPTSRLIQPGSHAFVFTPARAGGTNKGEWTFNFTNTADIAADLPFQFMPPEITNSLGMRMMHVTAGALDGYVSQFEVTISQYAALMGSAPCRESSQCLCKTDDCPVVLVGWNQAQAFCDKLSNDPREREILQANNLGGARYELPTRADWRSFAPPPSDKGQLAGSMLTDNANKPDKPAGINNPRPPNEMGLSDVYGNVAEWCSDGATKGTIGGYYGAIKRVNNDYFEEDKENLETGSPDIGFRVLLRGGRGQ